MNKKTIFLIIVLILIAAFILSDTEVHSDTETESTTITGSTTPKCDSQEIVETFVTRNGERNELVTKAFELSNGDIDFLLTVEAESRWNPEAIGDHGNSKGLCQWHRKWHKNVRNDPNFSDPDWQVQKCFEFYSGYKTVGNIKKRLYGYNRRLKYQESIKVQTGSLLVLNCTK